MSNSELFTHIGPRVEPGDVAISFEDAETFRRTALKGVKIKKLLVADHETRIQTTAFTDGIVSDASDANGEPVQDTYSRQHKAFEVQMTSDDVVSVDRQVERIVNRSRVTRGH